MRRGDMPHYFAIRGCRRGLIKVIPILVLNGTWHGTIPCFGPEHHDGLGGEMITPFILAHEGSVKSDCRHYSTPFHCSKRN